MEEYLKLVGVINEVVNVKYGLIHAALMLLNNVTNAITNDRGNWGEIIDKLSEILSKAREEGFGKLTNELELITPRRYLD